MESIWNEFAAEHPESSFPSSQTMRRNARLFLTGKRYRFALAVAGYRLLTGERPSRDLERAATWLEWYHLYTLFLDDIMDEDVRRRTLPSAWSTNAKLYGGPDANKPAAVFRTRRHRYGVSQAILDALRIRSLAERSVEGDIRQGKRTRLYVLALERIPRKDRAAFLRSYGRGLRTTKKDVSTVRDLLRRFALPETERRIESNLEVARKALDRLSAKDTEARNVLEALLDAQRVRIR